MVVVFCLGATFVADAQDEMMTNDEVISLTGAGLNKSLIVDKIRSSKSRFDLSTDALIKLKKAGVDDAVVAAMLQVKSGATTASSVAQVGTAAGDPNDPLSPHDFGIYMFEEKKRRKGYDTTHAECFGAKPYRRNVHFKINLRHRQS